MLLEAFNYAHDLQMDPWDFSVEYPNLTQLGLSNNDCRWLLARGLVEHAQEITSGHDDRRRFTRGSKLGQSEEITLTTLSFRFDRVVPIPMELCGREA
jgi:hypothetical protein